MQYLNGIIGGLFLVLVAFQLDDPNALFLMTAYGIGASLAFVSLTQEINLMLSRVLAVLTTVTMFFYFAKFFYLAHGFSETWYEEPGLEAIGLLFAAFAMIPVLSDYSCRAKADCRDARLEQARGGFLSGPSHIDPPSRPKHP
jgi:hypothetical protein